MSNMEYTSGRKGDLSIDKGWARELAQACAELELPHDTPTGCGAKAIAFMSFLRLQGIRRDDIGVAMAYVPDFSAEGLVAAEAEHRAMRFRQSPHTFTERLKTGIGVVDMGAKAVEWSGIRITEAEKDNDTYVTVERLAPVNEHALRDQHRLTDLLNANVWTLSPPGQDIYMCNHTAARLGDNMVIDPGYEKGRPLSMEEWRECGEFSEAVLLSSMPAENAVPFRVHADLMPADQRRRYIALLEENGVTPQTVHDDLPGYQEVMKSFMHLEDSVPWQDDPTATIPQRVSRLNARTILAGDAVFELRPDKDCEAELSFRITRLALAMTYQRWLEETEAVSLGA